MKMKNVKMLLYFMVNDFDKFFVIFLFSPGIDRTYLHQYSELKTTLSGNLHFAGNFKMRQEIAVAGAKYLKYKILVCCVIVFAGLPSPLSIPAGVIRLLLWLTKCLISALLWLLSATSGNAITRR